MPSTFTHDFNTPSFKGKITLNTGLFINNEWVDPAEPSKIDVVNPSTGKPIASVDGGSKKDVDKAVQVAQKTYDDVWGFNTPGSVRGRLLLKLADLMEQKADELAALESLDNGKAFSMSKNIDVVASIDCIRYYGGWADKNQGKTIETDENKFAYTRHEPIGVCGQIIPWNFPLLMFTWKIGPALATGNTVVLKPSEFTPLTALYMCDLIKQVGIPPGVVNVINGYGNTVGQAISEHPHIEKVAFTGSTLTGRRIMEAAAKTNLKKVTLELGGKGANLIFEDADLDQAVKWSAHGIFWNHGQVCCACTRVFVHAKIYDEFVKKFTAHVQASVKVGDPFQKETYQGPQVSQIQYDRIMDFIDSGKKEGAKVHMGGGRHGNEGYFVEPTLFIDTKPDMRIVKEEIFGPVGVIVKFENDDDVVKQANDTFYGLSAACFSKDINRAIKTAHRLKAGTVWVNCNNVLNTSVPFGGFKQSGIGRELGEYALANYTAVKAVHINLGQKM